jgi:ribosomal protein S27AE
MSAPLWTCPRCGHPFVTANTWHSCTTVSLNERFAGRDPALRAAFDRYAELISRCGPVTVIAQKTRIVIMGRVRFAGAVVRRDRLTLSFALTRRLDDPRFRVETYSRRWNAHRFEVRAPADVEIPGLAALLCESYRDLGMQGAAPGRGAPPAIGR